MSDQTGEVFAGSVLSVFDLLVIYDALRVSLTEAGQDFEYGFEAGEREDTLARIRRLSSFLSPLLVQFAGESLNLVLPY